MDTQMTDEINEIALEMVSVITVAEMRQLLFVLPKINCTKHKSFCAVKKLNKISLRHFA